MRYIVIILVFIVVGSIGLIVFQKNNDKIATQNAVDTNKVTIDDMKFTPASIKIKTGTTVVWTNNDERDHTVSSYDGDISNSPKLIHGQTYNFKFSKPGTFKYHCNIHPGMKGTVVVTN